MYALSSKLVCLFVQAIVFVQAKVHLITSNFVILPLITNS